MAFKIGDRVKFDIAPGIAGTGKISAYGTALFPWLVNRDDGDASVLAHEDELTLIENEIGPETAFTVGVKHDSGKSRLDLIPFPELLQIGDVLAYGASKYAPGNWLKVPDGRDRYLAATLRHLAAYGSGEILDPESGLPHLAHAATSLMFLMHFAGEAAT